MPVNWLNHDDLWNYAQFLNDNNGQSRGSLKQALLQTEGQIKELALKTIKQ
jgi:hypothetical protein